MYELADDRTDLANRTKYTHYSNNKIFYRDPPIREEHYLASCNPTEEDWQRIADEAGEWQLMMVYDVGREDGYGDNSQSVDTEFLEISTYDVVVRDGHFAGVVCNDWLCRWPRLDEGDRIVALIDHHSVFTRPLIEHYLMEMPVDKGIYLASYGEYERKSLELKWRTKTFYLVKKQDIKTRKE